jgi:2-hydroxy-3-oxopropionate reductase
LRQRALQGAKALGIALPQTANAAQLMQSCVALGHGQADHSAVVRALENMAQHTVTPMLDPFQLRCFAANE